MRGGTTRVLAGAVAALALAGCGRADERADRREDRREERAAGATAPSPFGEDVATREAEADGIESEADGIESELDEIDSLLAEDR